MSRSSHAPGAVIEHFDITPCPGTTWAGVVYQGVFADRPDNRRIAVKADGRVLWDSGDCANRADAAYRLTLWLAGRPEVEVPAGMAAAFALGTIPFGNSVEQIYYRRWRAEQLARPAADPIHEERRLPASIGR